MKNNKKEVKKLIMDEKGLELFKQDIIKLEKKLDDIRLYKGKDAIFQGDNWHDNPTLYQTESEERALMVQLADMKKQLENIEVVERDHESDSIQIGDALIINMIFALDDSEELAIKLVGRTSDSALEADIKEISADSPLGMAIYKKNISDRVSYTVNGKQIDVDIISRIDLNNKDEMIKKKK